VGVLLDVNTLICAPAARVSAVMMIELAAQPELHKLFF
jgi:hypothetical protein